MQISRQFKMQGTLHIQAVHIPRVGLGYKIRNLPHVLPGLIQAALARALGINHMSSRLYAVVRKADNSFVNLGLIGTHLLTTAFCELMVAQLQAETAVWGDFKYHDSGTGTTAENIADTTLETPSTEMVGDVRVAGTQVQGANTVTYRSVATITYDGAGGAITEHGLFNDTRLAGGTLMDRTVFAAYNMVAGESIIFTYEMVSTAGG